MDLREWAAIMKEKGELVEVEVEVDWNMEAAAITAQKDILGAPGIWFKKIRGYSEEYTLMGDPLTGTWKKPWRRVAMIMGLPGDISHNDLLAEWSRRMHAPVKPVIVTSGPCKEHIHLGKDANLWEFPWPYIHYGDGGRYGTIQSFCIREPVTGWTNWGNYRMMIHGKNAVGCRIQAATHHALIMTQFYHMKGEVAPVTVFVGGDPEIYLASCFRSPWGMAEMDAAGGVKQAPLELVKCETNDLLVPANAEIVLEGEMRPGELWDEGPFGEYAGFLEGPRAPTYVMRVNCITHKKEPVIPFACEGVGLAFSSAMGDLGLADLEQSMLRLHPDWPIRGISGVPGLGHHAVTASIGRLYPGFTKEVQVNMANIGMLSATPARIIASDDADPSDIDEVTERWALECNPGEDVFISSGDHMLTTIAPYFTPEEKMRFASIISIEASSVSYDATTKIDRRRVKFEEALSKQVQDWVVANWADFGFEEEPEVKIKEWKRRR